MKYFWKHCYEIAGQIHWALCDEESDKKGMVMDHRLVLFETDSHCIDGRLFTEQEMPKRIIDLLNKDEETCTWSRADEDTDLWETSCGHAFCLNDGTPKENNFKFCTYCGREIESA